MEGLLLRIPMELQPTDTAEIRLPSGSSVTLPVCRPVFIPWMGAAIPFDYGKKPLLDYNGRACFADLLILWLLLERGWQGVWIEAYGGRHYLRTMPKSWALNSEHVQIPDSKQDLLRKIQVASGTTACFDVLAWYDKQILFCEAKRSRKDSLTDAQRKFIEGALACEVLPESLLLVEWSETCRVKRF